MKFKTTIQRAVKIRQTPRVKQVSGIFEVEPAAESIATWSIDFELPAEWSIGVVVGKSGDGKTTIARWLAEQLGTRLIGGRDADGNLIEPWPWPADRSIIDGFPEEMGVKKIVEALSAVGFSSPPAWLRPYRAMSNGQQFRVNLARTIAEVGRVAIVDEFSSVVDRDVAKIGSAAVAKAVRRDGGKFVAVTCHYDVIDWLQPDWVYEPATNKLTLADAGRSVRRPPIELQIVRTTPAAWPVFAPHHYLDGDLHRAATCFVASVAGQPAAFTAVLAFPHAHASGWREHRTVCLPDFQGVGIGNAMSEYIASVFAGSGRPYYSTTSNPAMVHHRKRSPLWEMTRDLSMTARVGSNSKGGMGVKASNDRLSAGFKYVGPARAEDARRFGLKFTPAPQDPPTR